MPKKRINVIIEDKKLEELDDFIWKRNKKKKNVKVNRSEFIVNAVEFFIANEKKKVGGRDGRLNMG